MAIQAWINGPKVWTTAIECEQLRVHRLNICTAEWTSIVDNSVDKACKMCINVVDACGRPLSNDVEKRVDRLCQEWISESV